MTRAQRPTRGEVWRVRLGSATGGELADTRRAVVVSSTALNRLESRIIVPFTSWQDRFETQINKVRVQANRRNGLSNESAADVLQVRAIGLTRFVEKLGELEPDLVEEIVAGVVVMLDYSPRKS